MKICTSIALLSALPLVSGQSSAPSAASPIESLSPSAALPIDSLVPTATVAIESLVPTEAEIIESLTPTETESIESLVPTEAPDTAPPSAFDSSAPSASVSLFESLVPTGAGSIESLTPTTTVPAIEASCSAHAECLMEGMNGDCCPTIENVFLSCCDMGEMDTTTTTTAVPPTTGDTVVTADPLDIDEPGPDEVVTLTPKDYFGCMSVKGDSDDDTLQLSTCNKSDPNQQFKFVGGQIQLAAASNMCLQAGRNGTPTHGKYVRVYTCDSSNDLQDFTWTDSGRIYPSNYPDVTVVFQGTTPNVNRDRIIVADVSKVVERQDWVPLS